MKISIIIPVYNVEPYIERCMLSVLNQTYQNIEIILVDDCGQDNSISVARRVAENHSNGHKVVFLKHEQNRGLSAARNTGTHASIGDYLYYLDSDDEISPTCIETLVSLVEKYPGVEIVMGNMQTIPEPSKKSDWKNLKYKNFPEYVNNNYWIKEHFYCLSSRRLIPMNGCNKLINRNFIFENNLFFKEGIIHEDELWMFRVVRKMQTIVFSTEYTYIRYINAESIMTSKNKYPSLNSWYIILSEILENIDVDFAKEQKKKYINITFFKMNEITFDAKGRELYSKYKSLIKKLLKDEYRHGNKLLVPALFYAYKIPLKVRRTYIGKKMFALLIRIV